MFIANDTTLSTTPLTRVRRKQSTQSVRSDSYYDDTLGGTKRKKRHWQHRSFTTSKRNPNKAPRIKINVRGRTYETYIGKLFYFNRHSCHVA